MAPSVDAARRARSYSAGHAFERSRHERREPRERHERTRRPDDPTDMTRRLPLHAWLATLALAIVSAALPLASQVTFTP